MDMDSADSEGEDCPSIRPTLLRELRNILDEYPDDGQIIKELIQNAEDAGASVVQVVSDQRVFHQQLDPATARSHPHLAFLRGPALCVYNDAKFSQRDWEGIRMLHTSIKEKDPLKVGRFGLGFKSVFHLTDRLVIISEAYIMYMDPFEGDDRFCSKKKVAGRKGKELESILHCLEGVFGVTRQTFQAGTGRFPGTLFWFPLRQAGSDLSSTVYSQDNVDRLTASFRAEAPSLLLFLNNIQRVELFSREECGGPNAVFTVELAQPSLQDVCSRRQQFLGEIRSATDSLPENDVRCATTVVIETFDHQTYMTGSQRWLVLSQHAGKTGASEALVQLCADPQLSYRPYVGVAIPLSHTSDFQSQLFCFLPLPQDTRSPTGLPVHVHGYFALSQNRRHLKWPSADQLMLHSHVDPPLRWNCLLVSELLPKVYIQALLCQQTACASNPELFYRALPDIQVVQDRWQGLLRQVYEDLVQKECFYSHSRRVWLPLSQCVLQCFDPGLLMSEQVKAAVIKVYSVNEQNLVQLPGHVHNTLEQLGLLEGVEVINPSRTSELVASSLPHLTRTDKLWLLHYFCSCGDAHQCLLNQHLLPLADNTFGTFQYWHGLCEVFWSPANMLELFPGIEAQFCDTNVPADVDGDLRSLAKSGVFSLQMLEPDDHHIPALIGSSIQARFGAHAPLLPSSDRWITLVWEFLGKAEPWCSNLDAFSHLPLLPYIHSVQETNVTLLVLKGLYVCKSVLGMPQLSSTLATSLEKLGVTVMEQLPDYVTRHSMVLGNAVHYPTTSGMLATLEQVSQNEQLRKKATDTFNTSAISAEIEAIIHFIADLDSVDHIKVLFQKLKLFTDLEGQTVSLKEISRICPENLPSVALPWPLLSCSKIQKCAAQKLGATEVQVHSVVEGMLKSFQSTTSQHSPSDVQVFMQYFLENKKLSTDPSLVALAKRVKFVSTSSGQLKVPEDVYDCSSQLLKDLFYDEQHTKFPCGKFVELGLLNKLKKLGVRAENAVKHEDFVTVAELIPQISLRGRPDVAKMKAEGLWKYLLAYGAHINESALNTISHVQCLPCLPESYRPIEYPKSLPMKTDPSLGIPAEMYSYELLLYAGSAVSVVKPGLGEYAIKGLMVKQNLKTHEVLEHLNCVIRHFNSHETLQYRQLLCRIFRWLKPCSADLSVSEKLASLKCILLESSDQFAHPKDFWIGRKENDVDLKPYMFPLPREMADMEDLLLNCGASLQQDSTLLRRVLAEIEMSHGLHTFEHPQYERDMQLTKQILDVLKKAGRADGGRTVLPIMHDQMNVLRFKPAKDCTILPPSATARADVKVSYDIFCVHPDISNDTAEALGALVMKRRARTGLKGINFAYGQKEELTTRLHNLLKDSYTDGFSVPKELIQNADDAGATEVAFLLDERENHDARKNLLSDDMAFLQGPAIWSYNDAVFQDSDFENITKLGAGTKKEDVSKIGRFGLGFNAVYNLTDVPFFLSRNTLAMLDPHGKYLEQPSNGFELDFSLPINQDLLSTMPEQFQPFQNVFGCNLRRGTDIFVKGTLFRFPLRTDDQAKYSKIKSEGYPETKRREFLKMLLYKAGNLLMFTQNVKKIQIFHLPSHCADPKEAQCLQIVTKTSEAVVMGRNISLNSSSILQFLKAKWSEQNRDFMIKENMSIEIIVTKDGEDLCGIREMQSHSKWILAWATGVSESAKLAVQHRQEGLVPLAAVAVPVDKHGIKAVKDSPLGFYTRPHLFCFMPLPEEMASTFLPVHLNGTFALSSSRRGVLVRTEDDFVSIGTEFNSALYGDAVCRAYFLLLEQLKKEAAMDSDFSRYFQLWPRTGHQRLLCSFYKQVVNTGNQVFPVPSSGKWVVFKQACILQPEFRDSECGKLAWDALQKIRGGSINLVDIPTAICRLVERFGPPKALQSQTISQYTFYAQIFFPHVSTACLHPEHRDKLVLFALMQDDKLLNAHIEHTACIPCEGVSALRTPRQMIHPRRKAASLFLRHEGRFPQTTDSQTGRKEKNDFCTEPVLQRLSKLGMINDMLPWDMLLERAESVEKLCMENELADACSRSAKIVEYLSLQAMVGGRQCIIEMCPEEVKQALSETAFLRVLQKPLDWPFPWFTSQSQGCNHLASPRELYSDSLKYLVACKVKLLDTRYLCGLGTACTAQRKVLQSLGVIMEENYGNQLAHLAAQQLFIVAKQHSTVHSSNKKLVQTICNNIYKHLHACMRHINIRQILWPVFSAADTASVPVSHMQTSESVHICSAKIVWTGAQFVQPSKVAFVSEYDCSPYLFKLEHCFQRYRSFFEAVGVKTTFDASSVVDTLGHIKTENDHLKLSEDKISLASRVAQLLEKIVSGSFQSGIINVSHVFLPDRHGYMQPASCLCVDDCEWLTETDSMKFVHDSVPASSAKKLGVKTKKSSDFGSIAQCFREPFGQKEKLTKRIKRLLEVYTFDSSLFKELLQNADDAGATEVKFIKDFRQRGTERILDGLEVLQGPSLCVYNNRSFTKHDMEGIQNLGEGSKGHDLLKTGQFGVGFNAVYHITDVPAFWTREGDETEVLCVFDPNRCFIKPRCPGVKFTDVGRIKTAYPDTFSGFLGAAVDMTTPGTLFRFPLRTRTFGQCSELSKEEVTEKKMAEVLAHFISEMSTCLLFLNNLRKIEICRVKDDGTLQQEYEVNMQTTRYSPRSLLEFKKDLDNASNLIASQKWSPFHVPETEAVVKATVRDPLYLNEEWLIVHRLGFQQHVSLSQTQKKSPREHFRLLPLGGVAVNLNLKVTDPPRQHKVFCTLPLPANTHLPMHVNGHFILDHETRRNLWENNDQYCDGRYEWNVAVALKVIVPAYITALQSVKEILFPINMQVSADTESVLQRYHALYPQPHNAASEFWAMVTHKIYKVLGELELTLFPVKCMEERRLEWVPAVRSCEFPGYFSNLAQNLLMQSAGASSYSSYVDPFRGRGLYQQNCADSLHKASETARELQVLLRAVNMKVLETPFEVFKSFRESGVQGVQEITPDTVLQFLKSACCLSSTACNIRNLPMPVMKTSLRSAENVQELINFVSKADRFYQKLEGLPLCLRQSGQLYTFSSENTTAIPVVSTFCALLPGSANDFLHSLILKYIPVKKARKVVQTLNLSMFAKMLPYTLKDACYRSGKPCDLNLQVISSDWIKTVWKFIESQLKSGISSNHADDLQRYEAAIQDLCEWSLIPVKKRTQNKDIPFLYPVKFMHLVVHVPVQPDCSNFHLWSILKSLPLPFLDTGLLPAQSVAKDLVASISHPLALLDALSFCSDRLTTSVTDAQAILNYFNNSISVLKQMSSETALVKMLKQLPLYQAIDGSLISVDYGMQTLCLSLKVPRDGLTEWSNARSEPLLLLRASSIPIGLQKYLQLSNLEDVTFYSRFLLPTLDCLPLQCIEKHMTYLRNCYFARSFFQWQSEVWERNEICEQLQSAAFICVGGTLHRAAQFYTPFEPVFKAMCTGLLPPAPYNTQDWREFMSAAGVVSNVTTKLFVKFAKTLETIGKTEVTQSIVRMSRTLIDHLINEVKKGHAGLLPKIKDICFILPSDQMPSCEDQLAKIAPGYSPKRLVSYSESCLEDHLYLVWSSSCILHPSADPRKFLSSSELQHAMQQLQLHDQAPKDKVLQHAMNICKNMSKKGISELLKSNRDLLINVMDRLYAFLNGLAKSDLHDFKQLRIICHIEQRMMLWPGTVVIELHRDEMIRGYIEKAPVDFGRYFDLFQNLGAAQCVTAGRYAAVLYEIRAQTGDKHLHAEEMKVVQKAVAGMFRCLRGREGQKDLAVNVLYLPTRKKTLQQSNRIVFVDKRTLGDRLQELPENICLDIFLDFKKLEIDVKLPLEEVSRLPPKHRMVMLSDVVKEVVTPATKNTATNGQHSRCLASVLSDPWFRNGIVRLTYDHHKKHGKDYTEQDATNYQDQLSQISVLQATVVETVLTVYDETVSTSKRKQHSFVDNLTGRSRQSVIYIDAEACSEEETGVLFHLASAIQFVLGLELDKSLLFRILHDTKKTPHILDEAGVKMCDLHRDKLSVIPRPGDFIPLCDHCHLDNSFYEFYESEHAGFEVYDPITEDEDIEGESPIYIYAVVLHEVARVGWSTVPLIAKRYLVDLGPGRGTAEIPATQLYKFHRRSTQETDMSADPVHHVESTPVAGRPHLSMNAEGYQTRNTEGHQTRNMAGHQARNTEGHQTRNTEGHQTRNTEGHQTRNVEDNETRNAESSQTINEEAELREIRRILTEAWQICDEKERRRVFKRLLLKWHPDKNIGNEAACTRITQSILRCEQLLNQGKTLPENNDEHGDDRDKENANSARPRSSFHHSFFDRTNARARQHRADYEYYRFRRSSANDFGFSFRTSSTGHRPNGSSSRGFQNSHGVPRTNPQPGEGRRWLRTAQTDLAAARAAVVIGERGHNWICFVCHQAVEKALKALLYWRNADGLSHTHSLPELAGLLRDTQLLQLAEKMESRIGPHTRMRYPDVLVCPKIPADVYTADDVRFACQVGQQVVERVTLLMQA